MLLHYLLPSPATALPPPRPGLVDPYTLRFRTTGQSFPLFPKEVLSPRPSPRGGKVPLAPKSFWSRITSWLAPSSKATRPLAINPSADNVVPLVLLIDFPDRVPPTAADNQSVANLFYGNGENSQNVAAYWDEVSYHALVVAHPSAINPESPDVAGWLHAGDGTGGTIETSIRASSMIAGVATDNVRILLDNVISSLTRQGFDFSPYVRASDNTFQSVIIVHPGFGAEDSGNLERDPYSHSAAIDPILVAPPSGAKMTIKDYTLVPAAQFYNDTTGGVNPPLIGIGVIVHEMGHLLGLPDLYPTAAVGGGEVSKQYSGVGIFDLMGYGLWGGNTLTRADNPMHLSAWSKIELGWTSPTLLTASSPGNVLPPADNVSAAYKIYPNGAGDESLFFLLETRRRNNPATVFDKGLPGTGILIWRVDNKKMDDWRSSGTVPLLRSNGVNNDNAFLALALMEADLDNTSTVPHLIQSLGIGPQAFGVEGDFFNDATSAKVFSRRSPVDGRNLTNSAPLIDQAGGTHLIDVGFVVTIRNFIESALDFLFDLLVELPYWRVFRTTDPPPTLNSNKTLSYGFDGSNRTWVGTADTGVVIYTLTSWKSINTFKSPRIQAMAFEPGTESMWVGTDQSLEKVRLDSIVASMPDPEFPNFPVINVSSIVVGRPPENPSKDASRKWIGGRTGNDLTLMVIFDTGANSKSDLKDHFAPLRANFDSVNTGETITAMAIDAVFSSDPTKDVLYIGTSQGRIFRNATTDGSQIFDLNAATPGLLSSLRFEAMNFPSAADFPTTAAVPTRINSLAVDTEAILWAATDKGVFSFARGDPTVNVPDMFNPYDLAGDNTVRALMYFPRAFSSSGSHGAAGYIETTGIALQETSQPREIVWVSYGDPVGTSESPSGGVERIDPNVLLNSTIPKDLGLGFDTADTVRLGRATMTFTSRPDPREGPASNDLIAVAGDRSNIWFATKESGAVRFGSGTILVLDKSVYLNEDDVATVSLVKESMDNPTQVVTVSTPGAGLDSTGFPLTLTLGTDGVYHGEFGFSTGGSDPEARKIRVSNGAKVEVVFNDTAPPFTKKASALWKKIAPFNDTLFIPGCFVATAAYGTAMAPEVEALRRFRDAYLLTHPAGRIFTALYYRFSPPLAAAIAGRPALRFAARAALTPACWIAGYAVSAGAAEKAVALLLVSGAGFLVLWPRRKDGPR